MARFDGKSFLVTGSAHGIGRAYSLALGAEGAKVGCVDVDTKANEAVALEICRAGGEARAETADVSDYGALERAVGRLADAHGGLDGIVNNAGLLNVFPISRSLFEAIPDDEWDRVFDVNVKGVWHGCRAAAPHLRARGGGSIVNIASSTVFLANPTRAHYVASKGAVIAMSRVLSRELGPDWIRVNVVCPGSTLSEENPSPETLQLRAKPIPGRSLKRVQQPADVVGTVLFLLSDESAFLTGQTIVVEGGTVVT